MIYFSLATPVAIERGLVSAIHADGKPCLTDAGLFAMTGLVAYGDSAEMKARKQVQAYLSFCDILQMAKNAGLSSDAIFNTQALFFRGVTPSGDDERSVMLAELCQQVVAAAPHQIKLALSAMPRY